MGNLSAAALCKICRLHDPVARGVAIGTGSHAVGTSRALQMGRVEGAVSSLSIAVAGVLTAVLCPILANFLPEKRKNLLPRPIFYGIMIGLI